MESKNYISMILNNQEITDQYKLYLIETFKISGVKSENLPMYKFKEWTEHKYYYLKLKKGYPRGTVNMALREDLNQYVTEKLNKIKNEKP